MAPPLFKQAVKLLPPDDETVVRIHSLEKNWSHLKEFVKELWNEEAVQAIRGKCKLPVTPDGMVTALHMIHSNTSNVFIKIRIDLLLLPLYVIKNEKEALHKSIQRPFRSMRDLANYKRKSQDPHSDQLTKKLRRSRRDTTNDPQQVQQDLPPLIPSHPVVEQVLVEQEGVASEEEDPEAWVASLFV